MSTDRTSTDLGGILSGAACALTGLCGNGSSGNGGNSGNTGNSGSSGGNTGNSNNGGSTGGNTNTGGTGGSTGTGSSGTGCPTGQGRLPGCGPFAVPFVAAQSASPDRYPQAKALASGTLYPDLDLPFHLKVQAADLPDGPLDQLRALEFVVLELGLYLDTHPDDKEAFWIFQKYAALAEKARTAYVDQSGPLTMADAAKGSRYSWIDGPWPWQYQDEEA